ncbi:N-6 DNA methylase [Exiguobacterium sp. s28]|uniref:N-6 DNA methylase n=1 Tax=Exiguobacterium sp. s28 TaxID=2751238 RepID=UPI001BE60F86|nr:N-6 DNA methylase [Exiguobacterium sp. s28]
MIDKNSLAELIEHLGYYDINNGIFEKKFNQNSSQEFSIKVDMRNERFIYPTGIEIHRQTTTNFSSPENFVVFEILNRLFELGYAPHNIEIEMLVRVGRGKGNVTAWADVLIKDNTGQYYAIIEAKTYGKEFNNAWKKTLNDGYQLFSYVDQIRSNNNIPYGILYASDFKDNAIIRKYHLLTFKDNEEFLKEQKNKDRKLYINSSNERELYEVWKETYDLDYSPIGMFEDNLKPFEIKEKQFTIEDIYNNSLDTDGLIHQFRTILRQHNVSGRENAFDRLLNLLLAKLVDEKQSEKFNKPLDFYWRGIAFDEKKALVDRLQRLYRDGMKDYLKEDVTYIDKNDVDNAFSLFKNDKDATRDLIQNYFEELKFYTDNFFAFIDVYNEELFDKNFEILSSIVRLFQNVSLTNTEQHQFLGDLFEKLLDQGIKQSEGQFFTPLPIVRFLVSSLPIENMIASGKIPKVIDYASGSGHFLTEYASQISRLVPAENHPSYFENIYGIEKESRLAKVSKVSALMYGAGETQIFFHDALSKFEEVEDNSFDVVIANPPYSVTGFLETLSEEDRKNYDSTKYVSNISTNKAIEVFFLERAKQLLKPNGVAAIVLPSSILQKNESVYYNIRKQLLECFDIIAIFEAGTGTFGKTGTKTNTLFLRKKLNNVNLLNHYTNRVDSWYKDDFNKDEIFDDADKLESFANLIEKSVEDVLANESLKERLICYLLAENQVNHVQIIQTPNNAEIKKFLGYEWSDRKGSEGIKYLSRDVQTIDTPLYNPDDYDDNLKVNKAIRQNFLNDAIENENIKTAKLSNMISWSDETFDLTININKAQRSIAIDLQHGEKLVSLGDSNLFELNIGQRITNNQLVEGGEIPVYSANVRKPFGFINEKLIEDFSKPSVIWGIDGDWQVGYINENVEFYPTDHLGYLRVKTEEILPRYIVSLIEQQGVYLGFSRSNRASLQQMKKIQIVIPLLEEQKRVVAEIERIEYEQQKAKEEINNLKANITETLLTISGEKYSLNRFFQYSNNKVLSSTITYKNYVGVDNLIKNLGGKIDSTILPTTKTVNKYVDGDILLSNIRPYLMKAWLADSEGGASNDVLVLHKTSDEINTKFVYYQLARKEFFDYEMLATTGMKMPRGDKNHIMNYQIIVPDVSVQNDFINQVELIEQQIIDLKILVQRLNEEKKQLFN